MGADAQPDVEGLGEADLERTARRMQGLVFTGDRHGDKVALLLDADPARRGDIGLNLARDAARRLPVLQRGEAVAMNDRVGVGGLGIEALTDEQTRLAMGIAAGADPANVRRQRDIARHPLPDEVQRVFGKPHVLAAAGDEIALRVRRHT